MSNVIPMIAIIVTYSVAYVHNIMIYINEDVSQKPFVKVACDT